MKFLIAVLTKKKSRILQNQGSRGLDSKVLLSAILIDFLQDNSKEEVINCLNAAEKYIAKEKNK